MGYGVDRGGGRESKGGSLRRSKKNPGAAAARQAKATKHETEVLPYSKPAPPLKHPSLAVDCSVALFSRKLDATRDRILELAVDAGCGAMVVWSADWDKQTLLAERTEDKVGQFYVFLGIHPDNVDRTNKRQHAEWLAMIGQIAKAAHCVGVLTGINLTRDHATHFAQESLLRDLCKLANESLHLPVILHTPSGHLESLETALQIASEAIGPDGVPIVLHNVSGHLGSAEDPAALAELVASSPCHCTVSAAGICDDVERDEATQAAIVAALKAIGPGRVVGASNAPWSTPQNLEDEYLRELSNEPCNLVPGVHRAIASAFDIPADVINAQLLAQAVEVFQLDGRTRYTLHPEAQGEDDAVEHSDTAEGNGDEDAAESETDGDGTGDGTAPNAEENALICPVANASASVIFSCVKCRAKLFTQADQITHVAEAPMHPKAAQSKGARGRQQSLGDCDAALFLKNECWASSVVSVTLVEGESIECQGCGGKLGSLAEDVPCLCGKLMSGPTVRIISSRVDRMEDLSAEELLARAALEREKLKEEEEASSESDDESTKKKKGPKKNVKKSNKMNMSSYRNKNVISKTVVKVDNLAAELAALKDDDDDDDGRNGGGKRGKKTKKGRRRRGDSDSD